MAWWRPSLAPGGEGGGLGPGLAAKCPPPRQRCGGGAVSRPPHTGGGGRGAAAPQPCRDRYVTVMGGDAHTALLPTAHRAGDWQAASVFFGLCARGQSTGRGCFGGRYFFLVVFYWPSIMAPCVVGRGGGGRAVGFRLWQALACALALFALLTPRGRGCAPDRPPTHDARLRGSQGCVERPRVSVRLSVLRRGAGGDVDD